MNFVHPGGVMLAAVEMPGNSYPGTDFKSAFVNASVNPGMTSEACAQFALPEPGIGTEASSSAKIEDVKIGAVEFHEVENAMMKQADARYYHVFSQGVLAMNLPWESGPTATSTWKKSRRSIVNRCLASWKGFWPR